MHLGQAGAWNAAEFNVFGPPGGYQANFDGTPTIDVKISVTTGSTASPTCTLWGDTGETNNLNLVPSSCCASGGASPQIVFTETLAAGVTPKFCLLNDIMPIEFLLR